MEINWPHAYALLRELGHTDNEVAQLAKVARPTINRVLNGTYPHNHEPGYSGGSRVLAVIREARDSNLLTPEQLKLLRVVPFIPE